MLFDPMKESFICEGFFPFTFQNKTLEGEAFHCQTPKKTEFSDISLNWCWGPLVVGQVLQNTSCVGNPAGNLLRVLAAVLSQYWLVVFKNEGGGGCLEFF